MKFLTCVVKAQVSMTHKLINEQTTK